LVALKGVLKRAGLRRQRVSALRMCCERNVLAAVARNNRARARILCYHSVGTPAWGVNDVSPARFRRHVEVALEAGYRFVPAEQIAMTGGVAGELAITFDDGLKSVATNAAPILAEYGIPWTLFVVSGWTDGRHAFGDGVMLGWDDVVGAAQAGATIGSHSVTHPNFGRLDAYMIARELVESREAIQARTGLVPTSFAIPFGQSGNWSATAARLATEAGYRTIYAQSEERRPAATVARTFITSFDDDRIFRAALAGSFDQWEEWL
jgi:peptidoglycan/xylan/chitin deacetylase (PgdA/CDA1 family)